MPDYKIIHNDCLIAMKEMEDNSIDFCVTDPPYGLTSKSGKGGFMGKEWDGNVPGMEIWQEALRICKPGAMLAAFGGSRTHHHLMLAIEEAGWEIRDCIFYFYGSGFPKSYQFGKKLSPEWHGYGTALKPAVEIIVLAMKKLQGGFKENAEKWGVAGINIDKSRIFTEDNLIIPTGNQNNSIYKSGLSNYTPKDQPSGRWPANIIFDEESAEQLDQMTGVLKSGSGDKHSRKKNTFMGSTKWENLKGTSTGGDSGGASRFFYCAKASSSERNKGLEGMPEHICPKNGVEKRLTVGGSKDISLPRQNTHPTVKPISLMKYIITLLAPPGNPIMLDPFLGSGTSLVAAKELGISAIGIEKEKEYVEIATKRLDAAQCASQKQMEMF